MLRGERVMRPRIKIEDPRLGKIEEFAGQRMFRSSNRTPSRLRVATRSWLLCPPPSLRVTRSGRARDWSNPKCHH